MKYLAALIACLVLFGCTKDRLDLDKNNPNHNGNDSIYAGIVVINEILANPVSGQPDWIEIYNTTTHTVSLDSGKWNITDDLSNETKFTLNKTFTIPPHGYLQVFCDGTGTVTTEIHTSFSLSSGGEDAALFYDQSGTRITIDSKTFPAQSVEAVSYGRLPDGGSTWQNFTNPTPGQSNQ